MKKRKDSPVKQYVQIAIDGPSAAGKTTIAKLLAAHYGYVYLDTGAMYRCVGYMVTTHYQSKKPTIDDIINITKTINIEFFGNNVICNKENITQNIRTNHIAQLASDISTIKEVRNLLVDKQRRLAHDKNIVIEGRDTTSNILPDATCKFYVKAALYERAKRRQHDLSEKTNPLSLTQVINDITVRDKQDMTRKENPLVITPDAIIIDTTNRSIDKVLKEMTCIIDNKITERITTC